MKYTFLILLITLKMTVVAQSGFNRSYDLGGHAAAFCSLELSGDTVIVYGTNYQNGASAFGMLFARIDTFGNLLDYNVYNDSLEDDFTLVYQNSFIKLSDGSGYAGVGQIFQRIDGYMAFFDIAGNVTKYVEYEDQYSFVEFFKQVIELNDGFLILGEKQNPITYNADIFVIKTDFNGNIIWERKYPTLNRATYLSKCIILNINEYVISGSTTKKNVPTSQVTNTSKIFAIDSLGNLKWQWESQPSLDEMGAGTTFHTQDGKWVYFSARGWYNSTYNEISRQPIIVVRDSMFNLIQTDTFGVANSPVTVFLNTISLHNGGWLAVGTNPQNYATPPLSTEFNALSGWMYKIDSNVNKVWSRVDTAFWSTQTGSANYLYDAIELPSGSIIACGYNRTYEPAPKDWGWLIKVSADGCVDTLSCAVLPTHSPSLSPWENLRLYPNPAVSELQITGAPTGLWECIEVLNMSGQSLIQLYHTRDDRLDLRGLENGVYIVRLTRAGQTTARKVVKQ
ncbi:MAG: T9SS type A sorting domain-containing protein [Saprospiraceae bacterium]|nr:T9SS type A sorting domain-containing protein [Saprospiraceae bacterium]